MKFDLAQQAVQAPAVGLVIRERYRLTRPLGEGTFAWVFEAQHEAIDSLRFAVKVLKPSYSSNPDILRRFRDEATTVAKLQSRHTVRVFDFGVSEGGLPYIVMELVVGLSLRELLEREGRLSAPRTAVLALGIARALAEAHQLGVVHRDLKPANILVTQPRDENEPVAKVLDFGIAKVLAGEQDPSQEGEDTVEGLLFCSPKYAAPEVLLGKPALASDIYSLGHVMAEMLEGKAPYSGEANILLAAHHLSDDPVPVGQAVLESPLAPIIMRAISKDLGQRFSSTAQLVEALTDVWLDLRSTVEPEALRIPTRAVPAVASSSPPASSSPDGDAPDLDPQGAYAPPTSTVTRARALGALEDQDDDDAPDASLLDDLFEGGVEASFEAPTTAAAAARPVQVEEEPAPLEEPAPQDTFEPDALESDAFDPEPENDEGPDVAVVDAYSPEHDADEALDAPPRKRGGLGVVLLLLVAGGGAAAWFFTQSSAVEVRVDETPTAATVPAPAPVAAPPASAAPQEPDGPPDPFARGRLFEGTREAGQAAQAALQAAAVVPEDRRFSIQVDAADAVVWIGTGSPRMLPMYQAWGTDERPIEVRIEAPGYAAWSTTVTAPGQVQLRPDLEATAGVTPPARQAPVQRPAATPPAPARTSPATAPRPAPAPPAAPAERPAPAAPTAAPAPAAAPEAETPSAPAIRHTDLRNPFED